MTCNALVFAMVFAMSRRKIYLAHFPYMRPHLACCRASLLAELPKRASPAEDGCRGARVVAKCACRAGLQATTGRARNTLAETGGLR